MQNTQPPVYHIYLFLLEMEVQVELDITGRHLMLVMEKMEETRVYLLIVMIQVIMRLLMAVAAVLKVKDLEVKEGVGEEEGRTRAVEEKPEQEKLVYILVH